MNLTLQELDAVFKWLCHQLKYFPDHADIWSFRRVYPLLKCGLLDQVNQGRYRFSVQHKIVKADGSIIHLWPSQGALVMKLLADRLQGFIQPSPRWRLKSGPCYRRALKRR
jgi:hypothetical protein